VLVYRSQHFGEACYLNLQDWSDELQPTNQPKKLTKGGVKRRCQTSSLVRFNHSYILNALLEIVNDALNWNWGFAYANRFASQQKPLTFQARGIAGSGGYPIRQLILHPRILVRWFSWELNPEVLGSFWLKASATWGGSLRLKAFVMGRQAMLLFLLCPVIRLTTEEKHGKPQSGQEVMSWNWEGLYRVAGGEVWRKEPIRMEWGRDWAGLMRRLQAGIRRGAGGGGLNR
jgi:hypothetical protein